MAFPGIFKMLFENDGAGPLFRSDKLPLITDTYSVTLTDSGPWLPQYVGYHLVEVQGAGGGSGSVYAAGTNVLATGGGASGEYIMFVKYYSKDDVVSCTIGARGLGGTVDSSGSGASITATPGGDTTFDGVTAKGGAASASLSYVAPNSIVYTGFGGASQKSAQGGENAATGYWNKTNSTFGNIYSGAGGNSPLGQGGGHVGISTSVQDGYQGPDATGYGAGGGGAVAGNGANYRGGHGSQGCVRVTFLGV